jgi:hypothetical protein
MSMWFRQLHRWLAFIFTLFVIANVIVNFVLIRQEDVAFWVGSLTLIPLGLLMVSGLYLLVLPYVSRRSAD